MRGKATGGTVAILNADTPTKTLWSYVFYDKFCRVIQTRSDHHLEGEDIIWSDYNYPGWLLKTRREHTVIVAGNNQAVTIQERYDYDHIGRLLRTYHQINNEDEQLICENSYNERDELQQKRLGVDDNMSENNDALQEVDYNYNIRGWLTKINELNDANDLFAMELKYTENIAGNFNNDINYNGNITAVEWKFQSDANSKIYSYEYDDLNRLTTAVYGEHDGTSFLNKNRYNSAYSYDENGNILTLERKGRIQNNVFATVDDMIYSYFDDGRLEQIEETSEETRGFKTIADGDIGQYQYDLNGNMTNDDHKDIVVGYNYLNLPISVDKSNEGSLIWSYDATGKKLSKQVLRDSLFIINEIEDDVYNANWITSTGNVDVGSDVEFVAADSIVLKAGFSAKHDFVAKIGANEGKVRHYCSGIEYLDGEMEAIYHDEGRVLLKNDVSIYEYLLRDHLENTRVVFFEQNDSIKVKQQNDYYAFGLEFEQQNNSYAYLYNDKEIQTELGLGWLDFGARCYAPDMARFIHIDPISEQFPFVTPYNYAENSPIAHIDLWGLQKAKPLRPGETTKMKQQREAFDRAAMGALLYGLTDDSKQGKAIAVSPDMSEAVSKENQVVEGGVLDLNLHGSEDGELYTKEDGASDEVEISDERIESEIDKNPEANVIVFSTCHGANCNLERFADYANKPVIVTGTNRIGTNEDGQDVGADSYTRHEPKDAEGNRKSITLRREDFGTDRWSQILGQIGVPIIRTPPQEEKQEN
ncbi:MAG: RHS repeat-associated core domain-containing protein [Bacteroidota bacterium]